MTASQVLQKTTTLLHMIHLVISIDCGCFSKFPTIRVLSHEMQADNTHIQINPKHTPWEGFLAAFETSKLFIIPLINHKKSTLRLNFCLPKYIAQWNFSTFVGDRNPTFFFFKPQPTKPLQKPNPFYLSVLLLILLPFHREISASRTLLDNSLATQSSNIQQYPQQHTQPKQTKNDIKILAPQTPLHFHQCSSLFPCCCE